MHKIVMLLPVAGLALAACGTAGTSSEAAPTVTVTAAAEPAPTVTVTAEPEPAPTVTVTAKPSNAITPVGPVIEPGMYLVGSEVKPGMYRTVDPVVGLCYMSQDRGDDIINNATGDAGRVIFTVVKATGSTFTVDSDCGPVQKVG